MKRVLIVGAVAAIALMASPALALTVGNAANFQTQNQIVTGVDLGANGGISGMQQQQLGVGVSDPGGMEGQGQVEIIDQTYDNGYANHTYFSATTTGGMSANGGAHAEGSQVQAGIATLGDGTGTLSASGSVMQVTQGSAAIGNAVAGTGAYVGATYTYDNIGNTSEIHQSGESLIATGTVAENGISAVHAEQYGGTIAGNDGNGTAMTGAGAAHGEVDTVGDAMGFAGQMHTYEQTAVGPGTYQYQTGYVGTIVSE